MSLRQLAAGASYSSVEGVVGQLMQARWRDEGSEAFNRCLLPEGKRLEDEVRCPITEGRTQLMHNTAIGREQSLVEDLRGNVTGLVLIAARFPRSGHPWSWTVGERDGHATEGEPRGGGTPDRGPVAQLKPPGSREYMAPIWHKADAPPLARIGANPLTLSLPKG